MDFIDTNDPDDVRFWIEQLGCTATVLRDAVMICGPSALEVRKFVAGVMIGRQHEAAAIRARELAAAVIARSGRERS